MYSRYLKSLPHSQVIRKSSLAIQAISIFAILDSPVIPKTDIDCMTNVLEVSAHFNPVAIETQRLICANFFKGSELC